MLLIVTINYYYINTKIAAKIKSKMECRRSCIAYKYVENFSSSLLEKFMMQPYVLIAIKRENSYKMWHRSRILGIKKKHIVIKL